MSIMNTKIIKASKDGKGYERWSMNVPSALVKRLRQEFPGRTIEGTILNLVDVRPVAHEIPNPERFKKKLQ